MPKLDKLKKALAKLRAKDRPTGAVHSTVQDSRSSQPSGEELRRAAVYEGDLSEAVARGNKSNRYISNMLSKATQTSNTLSRATQTDDGDAATAVVAPASITNNTTAAASTVPSTTLIPPITAMSRPDTEEYQSMPNKYDLLYIASRDGQIATVKGILLQLQAQGVRGKDEDEELGKTLRVAAALGYSEIVLMLLRFGVDVNATDPQGNSSLHRAVRSGCGNVVRLLIENGADPFLGSPSPIKLAEILWNPKPLAQFRKLIQPLAPAENQVGATNDCTASRPVQSGTRRSIKSATERFIQNSTAARPIQDGNPATKAPRTHISQAGHPQGVWPDRTIIYRGERLVMPPSDPAYWN